jgi:hypothetical protein
MQVPRFAWSDPVIDLLLRLDDMRDDDEEESMGADGPEWADWYKEQIQRK